MADWLETGGRREEAGDSHQVRSANTPFPPSSTPGSSPASLVVPTPPLSQISAPSSNVRAPTLRTRSTGSLLLAKGLGQGHAFDPVEDPSPVLSPGYQGLDGLTESLAHLMKQQGDTSMGGEMRGIESASLGNADLVPLPGKTSSSSQYSTSYSQSESPLTHGDSAVQIDTPTNKSPQGFHLPLSPAVPELVLKSPPKASSTLASASAMGSSNQAQMAATTSSAAVGMLRKASADQSATTSHTGTPPESGRTTPGMLRGGSKSKPTVLETHHLQLQTHGPSGRRMINQYIIETELGRGVHGKVRLARDTETGEKVAVKIVEREGKKRLGGSHSGWLGKQAQNEEAWKAKGKSKEMLVGETGEVVETQRTDGPHARFASQVTPSPPRSPGLMAVHRSGAPASPANLAAEARYGRWGTGPPSRPTYGDKEAERLREKERAQARKRLLWTTDKKVKREIALLKKCAHENVVRLKEVIDDPSSKKIFMILEFMEGGEVQWKDGRGFPTLTVDEARRTLRDVVLGLEYLHYQGIIHRDIKPANLLWDADRRVKISDFGVSHFSYALLVASGGLPSQDSDEERMKDPSLVDDHELAKTAGSPAFFAPELCLAGEPLHSTKSQLSPPVRAINKAEEGSFPWLQANRGSPSGSPHEDMERVPTTSSRRTRPPITKAIDVWALGVTLYCLLFGHVPFTADSEFALFAVIPREDYELPAFMGADRIRIGPRRKRWTSLPQWTDEEADVHRESEVDVEADVDPAKLSEEARLVRDLLDRLLEKDPSKRIKLDEVKMHPWVLRDIADPPQWLSETDPTQLPFVQVSNEEVEGALTGFSKIKQTLKRIQSKLFAGLGVPHGLGVERIDQHRRLQTSADGFRRQRSKSASHANGITPLTLTEGGSREAQTERGPNGLSAPVTSTSTPRYLQSSHRPHHFFSRRQSAAADAGEKQQQSSLSPAISLLRASRGKSRSQPNSRPHSPAVGGHEGADDGSTADMAGPHVDKGHAAQRRPSSFFKRGGGRSGAREGLGPLSKNRSTEALGSFSMRGHDSFRPSSRPSSKGGPLRMNSSSVIVSMAKSDPHATGASRSSFDSDAGHWSLVSSSSPSGNTTLAHSQSNRPRSRSRLGDVFRNVLSHHHPAGVDRQNSRLRSRPGTASSQVTPTTQERNSDRSLHSALAVTPLTAAFKDTAALQGTTIENGRKEEQREDREVSSGRSSVVGSALPQTQVDDYDVDLDLSDDDLDEGKGNGQDRVHAVLRNSGNGWVMERNESSTSSAAEYPSITTDFESPTPSVEGGYNLFKPPYSSKGQLVGAEGDETGKRLLGAAGAAPDSYAMKQVHSNEAEALRRASKKADDPRSLHLEPPQPLGLAASASLVADCSTMTEDRFADADEEESAGPHNTPPAHPNSHGVNDGDDEDEDGGVSFQARKRSHS